MFDLARTDFNSESTITRAGYIARLDTSWVQQGYFEAYRFPLSVT